MTTELTTTIRVSNCAGCPFSVDDGVEHWCHVDERSSIGIPRENLFTKPPDWCALRARDRLVTLVLP